MIPRFTGWRRIPKPQMVPLQSSVMLFMQFWMSQCNPLPWNYWSLLGVKIFSSVEDDLQSWWCFYLLLVWDKKPHGEHQMRRTQGDNLEPEETHIRCGTCYNFFQTEVNLRRYKEYDFHEHWRFVEWFQPNLCKSTNFCFSPMREPLWRFYSRAPIT